MDNISSKDRVEIIHVDCMKDENCVRISGKEKNYITRKICNMPIELNKKQRKEIGKRIIRKLWGAEIQGDIETINW